MKKSSYKQIRTYLKLTQQEISDILGMQQPGWQQVEKGNANLADDKKLILHLKYGIAYKYMIEGIGAMIDNSFQSSRTITIEINGKKTTIKESEFQSITIQVDKARG